MIMPYKSDHTAFSHCTSREEQAIQVKIYLISEDNIQACHTVEE
jgi:hypothetical protein